MLTGDAWSTPGAGLLHRRGAGQHALREGRAADVGQVVIDELHYYAEPDRGWAWQVPILELVDAQLLIMSATLGDVTRFVEDIARDRPGARWSERCPAGAPVLRVGPDPAARDAGGSAHHPPVALYSCTSPRPPPSSRPRH